MPSPSPAGPGREPAGSMRSRAIFMPPTEIEKARWRIPTFIKLLQNLAEGMRNEGLGERKVPESHIHRRAIGKRVPDVSRQLPTEIILIPSEASREIDRMARARCQLAYGPEKNTPRSMTPRLGSLPRIWSDFEGILAVRVWLNLPARQKLASEVNGDLHLVEFFLPLASKMLCKEGRGASLCCLAHADTFQVFLCLRQAASAAS